MININLKFYGVFNDYLGTNINLIFEENIKLNMLKEYISKNILINDLYFLNETLDKSIFSNDTDILELDYTVKQNDVIYLLPPFSGG